MRWVGSVAVLALFVSACAPTIQERVREFNEDGARLFEKGEYDHAREEFQAALMLQPNNPDLLFNLGQCSERLGQPARAEQEYQECLRNDGNHVKGRHALTVLLVNSGRLVEAQRMVQGWLSHEPKLSAAYAEDGWLYKQDGDPIKALKRYQQAIDFDARNTRALVEMGMIYEERGYPDRALLLYETVLDYDPGQPEVVRRINTLRARGVRRPHPDS
jgi:tetratricopeptide (TPR) repeat protein